MRIEILDTTLRDGEQTSGVSFAPQEKLSIARLLLTELHVDRIEIASARVSEGEFLSVNKYALGRANKTSSIKSRFSGLSTKVFPFAGSKKPVEKPSISCVKGRYAIAENN